MSRTIMRRLERLDGSASMLGIWWTLRPSKRA
jgi:hypothetical protein